MSKKTRIEQHTVKALCLLGNLSEVDKLFAGSLVHGWRGVVEVSGRRGMLARECGS